jgi:hypothetical protein
MDSPPLLTVDSPRAASLSPFDDDVASTISGIMDDAQTVSTLEDGARETPSAIESGEVQATVEEDLDKGNTPKLLKGKEKECTKTANKAPLRLLDLPVDVLKEIIHQVSRSLSRIAGTEA